MARVRKKTGPVATFIVGVFFVISGFVAMKYGQQTINQAKASADWPSVHGTISESDVVRSRKRTGTGTNKQMKTVYSAEVIYSYFVDGQTYESNQLRIGPTSSSSNSSAAYAIVKRYPKGTPVEVYYDPLAPEVAVLEPGVFFETKVFLYGGIAFLVIGILMIGGLLIKILLIGGLLLAKK